MAIAWPSGISGAPLIPCNVRNRTACSRDSEKPHKVEEIVKPMAEAR